MKKSELHIEQVRNLSDEFLTVVKIYNATHEPPIKKGSNKYDLAHLMYWKGVLKSLKEVGINEPPIVVRSIEDDTYVSDLILG